MAEPTPLRRHFFRYGHAADLTLQDQPSGTHLRTVLGRSQHVIGAFVLLVPLQFFRHVLLEYENGATYRCQLVARGEPVHGPHDERARSSGHYNQRNMSSFDTLRWRDDASELLDQRICRNDSSTSGSTAPSSRGRDTRYGGARCAGDRLHGRVRRRARSMSPRARVPKRRSHTGSRAPSPCSPRAVLPPSTSRGRSSA